MAVCYREGHRVDTKLCLMEQDHSRTRDQESTSTPPVEKRACGLEECPVTARWQKMPWTEVSQDLLKLLLLEVFVEIKLNCYSCLAVL